MVECPVMLMRNIDQANGLCNGTRLIVTTLGKSTIAATVITGKGQVPGYSLQSRTTLQIQTHAISIDALFCNDNKLKSGSIFISSGILSS